ncbi:MAG TPA: hypothetical protein VKE30_04570 [Chthoniobacterales bacterium]|nr:hypothetical protein [Chthoniobacterales bacterium]
MTHLALRVLVMAPAKELPPMTLLLSVTATRTAAQSAKSFSFDEAIRWAQALELERPWEFQLVTVLAKSFSCGVVSSLESGLMISFWRPGLVKLSALALVSASVISYRREARFSSCAASALGLRTFS